MSVQSIFYGAVQPSYSSWVSYAIPYTYPNTTTTVDTIPLVWPTPYSTSPATIATTTNIINTVNGGAILLPNANEVSLGTALYIRNDPTSSEVLQVSTSTGTALETINPGDVWWFQLTAYTANTTSGTWESLQLGSITSQATAAALAGQGLEAVDTKLNTVIPPQIITADYTITDTDESNILVVNSTGTLTITVPNFRPGFSFSVNNIGIGSVVFSGITVNNTPAFSISSSQSLTLIEDKTDLNNWWSLGLGSATNFLNSTVSINLYELGVSTGGNVTLTIAQVNAFVVQFYCVNDNVNVPITGDVTIYLGNPTSNWYFASYCTTTNSSSISLELGTPITPVGTPVALPMGAKLIFYSAINPATNILTLSSIPTVLNLSKLFFDSGTQTYDSLNPDTTGPSISFVEDPTSGMYLPADFTPTIVANGVNVWQLSNTTGTSSTATINASAAAPTFLSLTANAANAVILFDDPTSTNSNNITITNTLVGRTGSYIFSAVNLYTDAFVVNVDSTSAYLYYTNNTDATSYATFTAVAGSSTLSLSPSAPTTGSSLNFITNATTSEIKYTNSSTGISNTLTLENNGTTTGTYTFGSASSSTALGTLNVLNTSLQLNWTDGTVNNAYLTLTGNTDSSSLVLYNDLGGQPLTLSSGVSSGTISYQNAAGAIPTISLSDNGVSTIFTFIGQANIELLANVNYTDTEITGGINFVYTNPVTPTLYSTLGLSYTAASQCSNLNVAGNAAGAPSLILQSDNSGTGNTYISVGTVGSATITKGMQIAANGTVTFPSQNAATLNALMPTPTIGSIAYWDGTAWVVSPTPTGPGAGLYWTGTTWVDTPVPAGAGALIYWNGTAYVSTAAPAGGAARTLEAVAGALFWV